jgi:hypothetical protein
MNTTQAYPVNAADAALRYLLQKNALHKLQVEVPVIGRNVPFWRSGSPLAQDTLHHPTLPAPAKGERI